MNVVRCKTALPIEPRRLETVCELWGRMARAWWIQTNQDDHPRHAIQEGTYYAKWKSVLMQQRARDELVQLVMAKQTTPPVSWCLFLDAWQREPCMWWWSTISARRHLVVDIFNLTFTAHIVFVALVLIKVGTLYFANYVGNFYLQSFERKIVGDHWVTMETTLC